MVMERSWTLTALAKKNNSAKMAKPLGLHHQKSIRELTSSEEKIKASKEALLELAQNYDSLELKSGPLLNDAVETKYNYNKQTGTYFILGRMKELKCPCSRAVDFNWDLNLMTHIANKKGEYSMLEEISPMQKIVYEDLTGYTPMGPLMYPRDSVLIYTREDGDDKSIVSQHSVETPLAPNKPGVARLETLVSGAVAIKRSESTCDFIIAVECTMGGWFDTKAFALLGQGCGLGAVIAKDVAQHLCDIKKFVDNEAKVASDA